MVKNLPAMQEPWIRSLGQKDPLEEEMANHSSILAWRIPKDRGTSCMGSQRVGHNWATKHNTGVTDRGMQRGTIVCPLWVPAQSSISVLISHTGKPWFAFTYFFFFFYLVTNTMFCFLVLRSPTFGGMSTCPVFIGHLGERSFLTFPNYHSLGFPGGSDGKESSCNERDLGSIPGLGISFFRQLHFLAIRPWKYAHFHLSYSLLPIMLIYSLYISMVSEITENYLSHKKLS